MDNTATLTGTVSTGTPSELTGSTTVILPSAPAESITDKLKSRKLIIISLYILVAILNRKLDLGVSDTDMMLLTGAVSAYILGQSAVDITKIKASN